MSKFKDQKDKQYKRTPKLQEKLDSWLNENVNKPLSNKGLGNLGAGISAGASTLGSLFDSEDNVVAMSMPGTDKVGKLSKKALLDLAKKKTTDKGRASRRYKDIPQPSTKEAPTINWTKDVNKKFKEDPLAKMRREREHIKVASSGRKDVQTKPASGKITHTKKKGDPVTKVEFDLIDE